MRSGYTKFFEKNILLNQKIDHKQYLNDWNWQIENRYTSLEELNNILNLEVKELRGCIHTKFKFAITPHILKIIDKTNPSCPVRKQFIPSIEEIRMEPEESLDPCCETDDTKLPGLIHRYSDRAVLLITNKCAAYCRFCNRKYFVGQNEHVMTAGEFGLVLKYIKEHTEIREVIISGGDPLVLSDEQLEFFLSRLKNLANIEIIRIETRVPVVLPQRITPKLCSMLKKFHPLYINIHINHPKEITEEMRYACGLLADNGIPLGSQSVLLKGINDKPQIFLELVRELLKIRVRPYYIFQCDLTAGNSHFRTSVSCGLKIIKSLTGFISGLAVPTYVINTPGGKIPVSPDYIVSKTRTGIILKNYEEKIFVYQEPR